MKRRLFTGSALAVAGAALLTGCGGSSTLGTASNPQVRAVDLLTTPTTVNVTIAGGLMSGVNTFGNVSSYQPFTNGNTNVTFTDVSTSNVVINQNPLFTLNGNYTVIGFNGASGPALLVLSDSNHIGSTQSTVRFTKVAAGTASSVDVYVTAPGASLATISPTFSAVTLGSSSQKYVAFASGTYEVRETASGSKTAIIDQQFTLSGGTANTLLDDGTTTFFALQDQ